MTSGFYYQSRILNNIPDALDPASPCYIGTSVPVPLWVTSGGIIAIVYGISQCFFGLATVCEEYFCPALEILCEELHIPEDVAGATFMAIGSSAGDLIISVLALFLMRSTIGLGTIIGSEIFNHMIVGAAISMLSKNGALKLDPLITSRDLFGYLVALLALLWALGGSASMNNDKWAHCLPVSWVTGLVMLVVYVLYAVLCIYFDELCLYFLGYEPNTQGTHSVQLPVVLSTEKTMKTVRKAGYTLALRRLRQDSSTFTLRKNKPELIKKTNLMKKENKKESDPVNRTKSCHQGDPADNAGVSRIRAVSLDRPNLRPNPSQSSSNISVSSSGSHKTRDSTANRSGDHAVCSKILSSPHLATIKIEATAAESPQALLEDGTITTTTPVAHAPNRFGLYVAYALCAEHYFFLPTSAVLAFTMKDMHDKKNRLFYGRSCFVSVIWLGLLAEGLLQGLGVLGNLMGISPTLMGITISAVGASTPTLFSSMLVASEGHGDMAMSNALGANTFSVLVGLGLPWFAYPLFTGKVYYGIMDSGIIPLIISLIVTILVFWIMIAMSNWELRFWMGPICLIMYGVIIGLCCTIFYEPFTFPGI
jgi:K+-dependent Na+/Ca+ exchanger-like protein